MGAGLCARHRHCPRLAAATGTHSTDCPCGHVRTRGRGSGGAECNPGGPPHTERPAVEGGGKGKRQAEKLVQRRWGGDHGKQDTGTRDRPLRCLVPNWCFIGWRCLSGTNCVKMMEFVVRTR